MPQSMKKLLLSNEAIILSMTKKEREEPKVINGSRKKRIASWSWSGHFNN